MNWREIPGFEGHYEASDAGVIRSISRLDARGHKRAARVMNPFPFSGDGRCNHLAVKLSKNRKSYRVAVHRLVLLAFVGLPPADKPLALHRDDNPLNNNLANLRWGDLIENYADSVANGSRPFNWQKSCKLTTADIDRIDDLRKAGISRPKIARWIGLNIKTVDRALHRKGHVSQMLTLS